MALDMAEIEILLQRRYNSLREIERLTREMLDTVSRGDEISLSLMLDMRADEIEKYMVCQEQIWKKAEVLYQAKEKIMDLLDYMNVVFFEKLEES